MHVEVERLHGRRTDDVLPIDIIGVCRPVGANHDKSDRNRKPMLHSVM